MAVGMPKEGQEEEEGRVHDVCGWSFGGPGSTRCTGGEGSTGHSALETLALGQPFKAGHIRYEATRKRS